MPKPMLVNTTTIFTVTLKPFGLGDGLFLLLMLLFIIVIIIFACKPWRFISSRASRTRTIKAPNYRSHLSDVDDIERPLVSEDLDVIQRHSSEFSRNYATDGSYQENEGPFDSPRTHGRTYKQRVPPTAAHLSHTDSYVLDISDTSEDGYIGQTLKRPLVAKHSVEEQKFHTREGLSHDLRVGLDNSSFRQFVPKYTGDQRSTGSILTLEVIFGPSRGARCSLQSTNKNGLPLTLGRVSPSDLLVKDSEVSGKHALINWNLDKLKWELVDMGSLNGTLLNSRAVNHAQSGSRHWGDPIELASGDIITLGTTSEISVRITSQLEQIPFGVGMASDPMALRRGGKKLPMEDVCYHLWPLPGVDQFGLFGLCDGHGGVAAATSASKVVLQQCF